MRKKLLSILVLSVLGASTFVGCAPSTLTILSISEGNVSVMKAGAASWIEAEVGMSVEVGDSIKTGGNSSAEITFFDGSTVELQAGTEIEITSLDVPTDTDSTTIVLGQTIGSIIFRVTKIIDPASRYEVETPTGTVAIRGSGVQITVTEDRTTFVINLEGDIWAVAQGVELQIPEGRQCVIRPSQSPEFIVEVNDPNLEAAIREAIGKLTGDIYASDLEGLTSLTATERNITDLTGLEYCTGLTYLNLRYNHISDISTLADCRRLTELYLADNDISDISPLANLTNLTLVNLGLNQIGDISPLANLTSLDWLNLGTNEISDISPLANLTNLTALGLYGNQISDISPLTNLTSLTELYLAYNQISDISPLANLTSLTGFGLSGHSIEEVWGLVDLTELTWLELSDGQISDISALADCSKLTELHLDYNQIGDISPLANLTNLTELWLLDNQISDISPLVDNEGLSEGDLVVLERNPLSADSMNIYIPQLEARGVIVDH